jgi:ADP-L-glycero-D-manno-heptose 6-epimerase
MTSKENLPLVITGAAGFVGARLVEHFNRRGIPLISVDTSAYFRGRAEHRGLDFGRIVDRDELLGWLERDRPALRGIIHMGACTDTMELDEAYLKRVNLDYSKDLWNFCAREKLTFVYASSAATYGGGELGYDDDELLIPRLKPLNPYGESKRLFDLWALEQESQGHAPPAWSGFKFFNVYGFGERHKGRMASVILRSFDQIRERGGIQLFKSHREGIAHGEQKRDFVYVGDLVSVLEYALEKPIRRGILNLGTGEARTWLDLARAVFKSMERPEKIEFIDVPEPLRERYQYFTQARVDRLRAEGYTAPFTQLEDGVREYIARLLAASRG